MYGCTQAAKINAYKALVRPYLEYACPVWTPYTAHDNDLLESVQYGATRWINVFGIHQLLSGPNLPQLVSKK